MKVKICGLTSPKEAEYLNENKADFAGMVLFFEKSRRNIPLSRAAEIMSRLSPEIKTVAVTVSPTPQQVREIEAAGFDFIQIHGKLDSEIVVSGGIPIIKAFNVSDMDDYEFYHNCDRIAGYVFDALEPGSGKTFDWSTVRAIPRDEKLLILAGGLNPENVAEAVKYLKPDGVDVSSGVECENGQEKDPDKIKEFVKNARGALV